MAITRKDIKGIFPEIEDEKMQAILNLVHGEIDTIKDELDELRKANEHLTADLKTANDATAAAKKEHSDYLTAQENERAAAAKKNAIEQLIKKAGIADRYQKTVLGVTNPDDFKLNKDGTLHNADQIVAGWKETYKDFIPVEESKTAQTETPPQTGAARITIEQIRAIKDPGEQRKAIMENPQLFNR